jgi:hypothetical protein
LYQSTAEPAAVSNALYTPSFELNHGATGACVMKYWPAGSCERSVFVNVASQLAAPWRSAPTAPKSS